MSPLRHRMIEDMTVRNLSPYTQCNYLFAVSRLARHVRMSPAELGPEQLRDYLNHLVERKISSSYFNVNVAALRFLYTIVLERDWVLPKLPFQKRSHKLPAVLSVGEMGRFLATVPDRKMRAVLVTAYAAGLRVFAVPTPATACPGVTFQRVGAHPGLGGKIRDHGRGDLRLLGGKAAVLAPERELDGEAKLASVHHASQHRDVLRAQ